MINFLFSILVGTIPDCLFFTFFIIFTKKLTSKKILLFFLILIGYIIFLMICRYNLLLYVLFIIHIYLVLKLLYKSEIIDIFVVVSAYIYMIACCVLGALLTPINYWVGALVNKLLLLTIIFFKEKLHNIYIKFANNWNRHIGAKIKSITIRNISILTLNIMIVVLDICIMLSALYYFSL